MANASEYTISRRILARLGRTLDNPRQILVAIRQVLKAQSQRAFAEQKFGDIAWPARYPHQKSPKLNIAGAVQDLATGARIKARRFEDRPALLDTGILRRSIAAELKPNNEVEVGTKVPYALLHQAGGISRQPITPTIKANLETLLKYGASAKTKTGRAKKIDEKTMGLRRRLGFLFGVSELATKINKRPFLGLTDQTKTTCVNIIVDAFPGAQRVS
jgi:phage gpG-like protein